MVLIIDEDKRKRAFDLKDSLSIYGIPSIVTDSGHIKKYPEAVAAVAFADSEEYLNRVSLYCLRIPLLAVNGSGSRIYNKDVLFYDEKLHGSYEDLVLGFLEERYGISANELSFGELSITRDAVKLGLAFLKLTATEKKILILLLICNGKWVSGETIRKACFESIGKKNTARVSVHICNINKKAKAIAGRRLILTKRDVGYMMEKFV